MRSLRWIVVLCAVVALGHVVGAGARTVPYHAAFDQFEGPLIADGVYPVSLSLWTEAVGGELVWEEELEEVPVRDGQALVQLGSSTPLPDISDSLWLELGIAPATTLKTVS